MEIYLACGGEKIEHTAKNMVDLAKKTGNPVLAMHGDSQLIAYPSSHPDSISLRFYKELMGRIGKDIDKEHDCLILQGALIMAPKKMLFISPKMKELWKDIFLGVSGSCRGKLRSTAENWALLMQGCIAAGDSIENCAEKMFFLADIDIIDDFEYRYIVSVLSKVWIHGKQLDQWAKNCNEYSRPSNELTH